MPAEHVSVLEVSKKLLVEELMLDLMSINITVALEYCLLPRVVDYGGHENISSCWTCYLVTKHYQWHTGDTSRGKPEEPTGASLFLNHPPFLAINGRDVA